MPFLQALLQGQRALGAPPFLQLSWQRAFSLQVSSQQPPSWPVPLSSPARPSLQQPSVQLSSLQPSSLVRPSLPGLPS